MNPLFNRPFAVYFLCIAFAVFNASMASEKIGQDKDRRSILIINKSNETMFYSSAMLRYLYSKGFDLNVYNYGVQEPAGPASKTLSEADTIILIGSGTCKADGTVAEGDKQFYEKIYHYVKKGGGLFYFSSKRYQGYWASDIHFLKPLGVQASAEVLLDKTAVTKTVWQVFFAKSENVQPHAIAKGITRLFYPVVSEEEYKGIVKTKAITGHGGYGGMQTYGFVFDKAWNIVLKAAETTYSKPLIANVDFIQNNTRKEGYESAPPLHAERSFGEGKVVLSSLTSSYFLFEGATGALESIVLENGIDNLKSDGKKLLLNSLRFLADHSVKKRGKGAMKHDPKAFVARDSPLDGKLRNWKRITFKEPARKLRGIIGPRTKHSVGTGDVKDWKEYALKRKLDYIFFLEDFKNMTKESYAKLKQQCAELSDDNLLLLPGYTIENYIGMKSYFIGSGLNFPDDNMLDETKKKLGDGVANNKFRAKGQLSFLRRSFVSEKHARKIICGYYGYKDMPVDPEDCNIYDTIPIVTLDGETQIDDGFDAYKKSYRDKQYPLPISIQFLKRPEDLIEKELWISHAEFPDLDSFNKWVSGKYTKKYWGRSDFNFVSNGPEIIDWNRIGARDYSYNNQDEWNWANAICKIRLICRSAKNIKTVNIYDAENVIRVFKPNSKDFEVILHFDSREKQREIIAEIIDEDGKRAVTAGLVTKNHIQQQINCADRINQMAGGFIRRKNKSLLMTNIINSGLPHKRIGTLKKSPAMVFSNDARLGSFCFDGTADSKYATVTENIKLKINEEHNKFTHRMSQGSWDAENNGSHQIAKNVMSSMDALIADRHVNKVFSDKVALINTWYTLWNTEPRRYSTWKQRHWFINTRGDEPIVLQLWEFELTLKQDVSYNKDDKLGLHSLMIRPVGSELWGVGEKGTSLNTVSKGSYIKPTSEFSQADFSKGSWVSTLCGIGGGAIVYSLTDGLKIINVRKAKNPWFQIGLAPENSPTKAGEKVKLSFVVAAIPPFREGLSDRVSVYDHSATPIALKTHLGIGMPHTYQLELTTGEKIKSDLFCVIKPENGKARARFKKQADLISNIPVIIKDMNEKWTAVYYDYEQNVCRPIGTFDG